MENKPKKRPGAIGNIEEARKPKDYIGEEKFFKKKKCRK